MVERKTERRCGSHGSRVLLAKTLMGWIILSDHQIVKDCAISERRAPTPQPHPVKTDASGCNTTRPDGRGCRRQGPSSTGKIPSPTARSFP